MYKQVGNRRLPTFWMDQSYMLLNVGREYYILILFEKKNYSDTSQLWPQHNYGSMFINFL